MFLTFTHYTGSSFEPVLDLPELWIMKWVKIIFYCSMIHIIYQIKSSWIPILLVKVLKTENTYAAFSDWKDEFS